jgi:hypothetical protein
MARADIHSGTDNKQQVPATKTEVTKPTLFGNQPPDKILFDYLERIDSLVETVNRIMIIVTRARDRARNDHRTFIKPVRLARLKNDKKGLQEFVNNNRAEGIKLWKARRKAQIAFEIVPRTFLTSLISVYDTFLAELLGALYDLRPQKLFLAKKTIDAETLYSPLERRGTPPAFGPGD